MQLESLIPVLWTRQLEETIQFYTNELDFAVQAGNETWKWARLSRDGVEIMLSAPNEHIAFNKPQFTGSLYFTTNDVDNWWKRVNARIPVCYPLETFEWGMREFAIFDNNGYILQFGQSVESMFNPVHKI